MTTTYEFNLSRRAAPGMDIPWEKWVAAGAMEVLCLPTLTEVAMGRGNDHGRLDTLYLAARLQEETDADNVFLERGNNHLPPPPQGN